jgi:hypothetical protein
VLAAYGLLAALRDDTQAVLDVPRFLLAHGKNRTALLSAQGLPGRHGRQFPLVRRHRIRTGAGKPKPGLRHFFAVGGTAVIVAADPSRPAPL